MSEIKTAPLGATHTRFNRFRGKQEYWMRGLDSRWYLFDRRQWTKQGLPYKPNGLSELDKELMA